MAKNKYSFVLKGFIFGSSSFDGSAVYKVGAK